ncbi:McbB family protein [Lactobacillus sp. ESL0684]|uniref:McbB family protein n=1 Tax=Lactobacillus sp. ESL0684 TaxID=2983213 RepID=UPI0023F91566|nr:McbB family protein [Lactobacillus sp. ESL0684]WEV43864.1 McbB family protein [Lactobacillus sp. ESL0684]
MKDNYRVSSFIIYSLDDESWVLQTRDKVNIITDKDLIVLLKKLTTKKEVELKELKEFLNCKTKEEAVINYLERNGILLPVEKLNFNLTSSLFATNDEQIFHFIKNNYFDKSVFFNKVEEVPINPDQLTVVILNPYNPSMVKEIYNKFGKGKNSNGYLLVGFFYNFHFYLDNIYNPQLCLPTHFDHLGYIQSGIYSDKTNYTYQDLVNVIFRKDSNFNLKFPLEWKDLILISNVLVDIIIKIFDLNDSTNLYVNDIILQITDIDMDTRKVSNDSANFWEMEIDE